MSDTPPAAPPPQASPGSGRWWRLAGRGSAWTLATLLVPALVLAALAWLVATSSGLQAVARLAVLGSAGSLTLEGVEGCLLGPLRVGRLGYASPELRLQLQQLEVDWRPRELLAGRLHLLHLGAERLSWASAPSASPPSPPTSLVLPLGVKVDSLGVAVLEVRDWNAEAGPPLLAVADLAGALESDGRVHRILALSARSPLGQVNLAGRLDGVSPFPLAARLGLVGEQGGRAYTLEGNLDGDLLAPVLAFTGRGGGLEGNGRILAAPFAPVPLREARLELDDFDPALLGPDLPAAALHVSATLAPADGGGLAGPLLVTNRAPRTVDQGGLPLERLAARLEWGGAAGDDALRIHAMAARLPGGGQVRGEGQWLPGAGRVEARLTLEAVDLRRIDSRLLATRLAGRIEGQGDAAGQSVGAEVADARFQLSLAARQGAGEVALEKLRIQAGAGVLSGSGHGALEGERAFQFAGEMRHFDPRVILASAPTADLNLDFNASGRLQSPAQGQLAFRLAASRLGGHPLAGEGRIELAESRLTIAGLWLDLAGNRVEANGALGRPGDAMTVHVDAPRLDALGAGLGGRLALAGQVSGTLADPGAEFSGGAQYLVWPGHARVGGVNLQGRLAPGADGAVSLVLGASRLGRPGAGDDWLDSLALQLTGTRRDHELVVQAASGRRDRWRAVLAGGLVAASGWQGRLREVLGEGALAVNLEAPASLSLAADAASLGPATLRAGDGVIHLRETRWSPQATVLRGDLQGLGFGLVATDGGSLRRGQATLRLGAEWDLRLTDSFEGQARLYRESGDLVLVGDSVARLGLEAFELVFSARANRLAASLQARGSQLGELAASATAAAEKGPDGWRLAPDGALLGSARLAMPSIAWLGPLTNPSLATEGSLEADFSLAGTPAHPLSSGHLRGSRLGFNLGDLGLRLSGGTLAAEFDRDELRLTTLEFLTPNQVRPRDTRLGALAAPGGEAGRLVVGGAVDLASGAGRFNFTASHLPLLQRPERWLMVSGGGDIRSGWNSLDLTARLRADGGFIGLAESPAPSLSDDVVVLGRGAAGSATPLRLTVDVSLDLGPRLYLSALGVDTRLEGELRLRARDGQPLAAIGTVTTVGGVYEGYGQKLSIERGRVTFTGPPDNPALNVVALRTGLAVEAGVAITGTARRPRVKLVSEPDVPDTEKLSWIVLGRPPDSASSADMGLLIPAAQALLGGPGGGMTAQLANSLGLDQVSVSQGDLSGVTRGATSQVVGRGPTVVGSGTVSGQVVSLGKRLTTDAFLSFEQSLAGAESVVKLTYQLSRRLALVARGGTDNAVDLTYSFSFR